MTDNILKTRRARIFPARKDARRAGYGGAMELVVEVYPADKPCRDVEDKNDVKRGKKYYEAAEHILNALGWDGSCHCKSYGHDFVSVSIVGPGFADAVPVYVKIARWRRSMGDLLNAVIEAVKKVVVGNGWFAVDRFGSTSRAQTPRSRTRRRCSASRSSRRRRTGTAGRSSGRSRP